MIHPYRTALDLGIHAAGYSDSSVSAADPLLRAQDVAAREDKSSIAAGKLADFAVPRKDPRKVAPDTIREIVLGAT